MTANATSKRTATSSPKISGGPSVIFWLTVLLQLSLAGVFLYSSMTKFGDLYGFGQVLQSYGLLPDSLIKPAALLLPVVEVLVGVGVLIPRTVKLATIGAILLSLLFGIVLLTKWGTVMPYGCGCFGPGEAKPVGWLDVGKDLLLVLDGVLLYVLFSRFRRAR